MTMLSVIGDITCSESPKNLASYSGLVPGVEQSGMKLCGISITKEGGRELRWAMVEADQRAVKPNPHWKRLFTTLERRMRRNQVIVAIARHLRTVIWLALTRRTSYHH
jgi:transposase